jgi:hypothetical protein
MPKGIQPIYTNVIATGGGMTFNNIPQTYDDLYLVASIKDNTSGGGYGQTLYMTLSGDNTTNYSSGYIEGNGQSSYSSSTGFSQTGFRIGVVNSSGASSTSIYGSLAIWIPQYRNGGFKAVFCDYVTENNATNAYAGFGGGTLKSAAPVTSIAIGTGFALNQYSSWSLYGLKGS